MIEPNIIEITIKLVIALLLGGLLGTERIVAHKSAGLRTYALISMCAALFVMISDTYMREYVALGVNGIQPTYVLAALVGAIGFLTGGLFLKHDNHVSGLTTASGLWVTAGIGAAVGFGYYSTATIAAALTFLVFTVFWKVEQKVRQKADALQSNQSDIQ
jgi:putative Mg2+ transporter-C (MgtC) family protein